MFYTLSPQSYNSFFLDCILYRRRVDGGKVAEKGQNKVSEETIFLEPNKIGNNYLGFFREKRVRGLDPSLGDTRGAHAANI